MQAFMTVCATAAVLTAAAWAGEGEWPMAGGNPQRTSWTAAEVSGPLRPDWFVHFDPYISRKTQVIAADDTLLVSTSGGLYALDPAAGTQKWLYPAAMPLGHSPTVAAGVAYVGGFDRLLHAVDVATGQKLWTFGPAGAGFQTNPAVADGLVYAGNRDGTLYAVDARTGELRWSYEAGGPILFSPALADGAVYFAAQDCRAYALDAATGALRWRSEKLPGEGFFSLWPVVYRDCIVLCGAPAYRPDPPGTGEYLDRSELHDVFPEYYPPGMPIEQALQREAPQNVPVGPTVKADGPWPASARIIDASRAAEYFEAKPWRRTVFLLNRADGAEITFDYDGDGKPSYAPFLYFGTKSGSRFAPAVDKRGALYITCNVLGMKHISRGAISGWKWGTTLLRPRGNWAIDEPMGVLIGGDTLYWQTCMDREAGAIPLEAGGDWPRYYSYGATNVYKQIPDLWRAGWDFAYHKHGDQNPPVPYQGRVYHILNNAVVAWAPDGRLERGASAPTTSRDRGTLLSELLREQTLAGLLWQITADAATWPTLIRQEVYYAERRQVGSRYAPILTVAAGQGEPEAVTLRPADFASAGQMTHRFAGDQTLSCRAWRRSPTTIFETTSDLYRLKGPALAAAYPTADGARAMPKPTYDEQEPRIIPHPVAGADLAESWLLLWSDESVHRFSPVLVSLQKRPVDIVLTGSELLITYDGPAGAITLTPLLGLSAPQPGLAEAWARAVPADVADRCSLLNRLAKCVQTGMDETFAVEADGTVRLRYACAFTELPDAWKTPALKLALPAPELTLAASGDSPIRINGRRLSECVDLAMPVPMGCVAGVPEADTLEITLPGLARYWTAPPAAPSAPAPEDPLARRLARQVQAMLDAGHLRPGYAPARRDLMPEPGADYFRNPADTIYTLLRALPLLPADMQPKVADYVRREFAAYPPYKIAHIGYRDGTARERFDLPPEAQAGLADFAPVEYSEELPVSPQNFYALALYARQFGGAEELFAQVEGALREPDYWRRMAWELGSQAAGHIGYLRLARLAGADADSVRPIERRLVDVLIFRAARLKNLASIGRRGFEYAAPKWDVEWYDPATGDINFMPEMMGCIWRQFPEGYGMKNDVDFFHSGQAGFGYAFNIDFLGLTPETGAFLADYAAAETAQAVADYARRAPYWFVPWAEEFGGEGTLMPLHDVSAIFQAKALALKQPRQELERYLDIPGFAVGDLYHIQNLCAALEARSASDD